MTSHPHAHSRRDFLRSTTSLGVAGAFAALLGRGADAGSRRAAVGTGYGPPVPTADGATGLPLLRLPPGFRYRSFGWTLDPMADGTLTPPRHDGMAVVARYDIGGHDVVALVRNHELGGTGSSFAAPALTYDTSAQGGTTSLLFDLTRGHWISSRASLSGTVRNCAGGPTPWGSWLSGEETLSGATGGLKRKHGYLFEVPAMAPAHPVPLRAMGRFRHEAAAVDPVTGYVYLTEDDRYTSGFYRFLPDAPFELFGLERGGRLEMLRVLGTPNADLQMAPRGAEFEVGWVPVPDPDKGQQTGVGPFGSDDGQTSSSSSPFLQGWSAGGARFRRLEGCWYGGNKLVFTDTEGGRPTRDTGQLAGSVWEYDPRDERLRVLYESPSRSVLHSPDNLVVSPRGGILMCEDNGAAPTRLVGLSPQGRAFTFAVNNCVLQGQKNGFVGNYRRRELAGATFDPHGEWLFVNLFSPGITFAITGPWGRGAL